MAEQDATAVAITGGTINNTTIGATTATTGVFTTLTVNNTTGTSLANIWSNTNTSPIADLQFTRGTTSTWGGDAFTDYKLRASGGNFIVQSQNNATAVLDLLTFDETNNAVKFSPGGIEQARVSRTASAVNYVQVTGGATGNRPTISAQGSDNPISLDINSKGSAGTVRIGNALSTAFGIFQGVSGQTVVNYPTFIAGQTTNAIQTQATGTDTNISMAFQSKGTGAIDLAAGSSGVNISNGGTVTALTRTSAFVSAYTTIPTMAISAPTTAGGVQATASVNQMITASATIGSGGTGYTVGNVLTMVGGTGSPVGTFTVATVSAGVVTSVTATTNGQYTALPTNPVSTTGGTGSGCTLNVGYGVLSYTITNAGSGYIEQPTVTFSGGGGSGAAAFASVGGTPILASTSSNLSLSTANGVGFRIGDSGTANVNYLVAQGTSAGSGVLLSAGGADTNIQTRLSSRGTSSVALYTNNSSNLQFNAAHTASAVNYVQVTGSTTGSTVQVTAQGSDSVVGLQFVAKSASIIFVTRSGNARSFNILDSASPVNYLQVAGSLTGVAPILSAQGTDTNIDLSLTPKGTGVVKTTATFQAGLISGGTF
jgi:hypothetical protein